MGSPVEVWNTTPEEYNESNNEFRSAPEPSTCSPGQEDSSTTLARDGHAYRRSNSSDTPISQAVSTAFQENMSPLRQDVEAKLNFLRHKILGRDETRTTHDMADNVQKLATANSACSNKISQIVKNNSENGTTITRTSTCQTEHSIKFGTLNSAILRIKHNLETIQARNEHIASNQAKSIGKVASIEILSSLANPGPTVEIHDLGMKAQIEEVKNEVEAMVESSSYMPNLTNPGPSVAIQDLSMEARIEKIEKRPESQREKPGEAKTEDSSSQSSPANQGPTVEIQEMSMEAQTEEIKSSLADQGPTVEIQEMSMEAQTEEIEAKVEDSSFVSSPANPVEIQDMETKSSPTSSIANQGPTVEIQGMSMEAQTEEMEAKVEDSSFVSSLANPVETQDMEAKSSSKSSLANQGPKVEIQEMSMEAQTRRAIVSRDN